MTMVRRALQLTSPRDRRKLAVLVPMAIIVSGAEVIGASLVYSLLGAATGAAQSIEIPLFGAVTLEGPDARTLMVTLAVVLGVFFVAKALLKIVHGYVQYRIVLNMAARLSTRLLAGYLAMPYPFHLRRNSSDLIRNTNQVVRDVFKEAITPMVKLVAEGILIIALIAVLVSVSPLATVIAIVVLGLVGALLLWVIQPRLERLGSRQHELHASTLQALQQSFHGIRDIKMLGSERGFAQRYWRFQRRLAQTGYWRATLKSLPDILIELALLGFILAFFVVTIVVGGGTGEVLAMLGLFAYVGQRLQKSATTVLNAFNQMRFATAPIEQLVSDLALIEQAEDADPVAPLPFETEIRLQQVSFRYEGAHRNALASIDLVIPKGQVIGICGATGGGKTTLVDVISGLLGPTSGSVLVDGSDIATDRRAWRQNVGVVPQAVFLIDASLRANIAFGVADADVDHEALEQAVDLAQLRSFIEDLPEGLDTVVGERGVRISGGQRQRIAIARALYRRPRVLVFDEGTSALDNVTERELMAALARLRGDHTILLVAHRLSTVEDADRIVVLEVGRVADEGIYEELLTTSAAFASLASGGGTAAEAVEASENDR